MRMTKKVVSLILAVMMLATMIVVGTVSASAATTVTTAEEFLAIADADGEYVLGADINLGGGYLNIPEGRTVTIDFADYNLTAAWGIENHGTLTLTANNGGIVATKNALDNFGTATIKKGNYSASTGYGVYAEANSTTTIENGTFTAQECCVCTIKETHDATITIKKGTFTSADNSVLSGNGSTGAGNNTWTISGGTFNANIQSAGYVAAGIYAPNDDTWNISGGTFNITNGVGVCQRAGTVNIKGGTFNVTGDGSLGKVGDSRVVVPTGSAVVYDSKANYPAQSAEDATAITGGTFNTDQDPIVMVKADDTDPDRVTVTGGTFANDPVDYVDTTVYKVKYTNTADKVKYIKNIDYSNVGGSGTYQLLDDLTANSRIVPGMMASNVVFDLNGFTLTSTATDEAFLFSRAGSAANHNSYTIKHGTVIAAGDGVDLLANNADLTLENVNIVASGTYGVVTNGTKTGNNITATDSSITAGTLGIYKPSNGSLTLTDTDVTGKTAVYVKSGDVTIDGGTFTGTGAAADYAYNGNGANITGDAVVIDNCGYPGGSPTVTILDGNFSSANGDAVASYAGAKEGATAPAAVEGFIYGGEYSSNVTDLCAEGLVATEIGGVFSIVPFTTDGKADIDGYQQKIAKTEQSSEATGNDINTRGVRIATKVDRAWLDENADDFGYVVAKYTGDKTQAQLNFSNMKKDGGNGEKTISCKDTYNNGVGYGDANEYVTLAVNGMDNGDKAVARFYVVVNGVTYYANYTNNDPATFAGILAAY